MILNIFLRKLPSHHGEVSERIGNVHIITSFAAPLSCGVKKTVFARGLADHQREILDS